MNAVRTRFAPSPTGYLHIGGVRTALFSWLYARRYGGQFILRIEDTDRERSTEEAIAIILEGMHWLGLDYDEGPYYQTQRILRYKVIIQQLLDEDKAYHCYCSQQTLNEMREAAMARGEKPRYSGHCRETTHPPPEGINPVIRFKNPLEGEVIVEDIVQGRVVFRNTELDDLIIARSDGTPTYNLTVVVDDMDMAISHVIRGDDHLNNTPRQINIFNALNTSPPRYAHIPMIMGEDGRRLSKRHGAVSVLEYKQQGYLPAALLNYLVRLGWSHGDQEIFSREEMISLFDIEYVNKAAASINPQKLLWLNQYYIKNSGIEGLTETVKHYIEAAGIDTREGPDLTEVVRVQKERSKTIVEMVEQSRVFYERFAGYDEGAAKKHLTSDISQPLADLRDIFIPLDWNNETIHQAITEIADQHQLKMGKIAQPLRVAVTGSTVSPSIDDTLRLIGKDECLKRLDRALSYIKDHASA